MATTPRDSSQFVTEGCIGSNITSTTTVTTSRGNLLGIFVSSASGSPTLKIADDTTTKINTFTPVAATWYPMPMQFNTSLIVTVGGTLDCCVLWSGA